LATTYVNGYFRIYFNVLSLTSIIGLMRFRTAADASIIQLLIGTDGKLSLKIDATNTTIISTTIPGAGWHALELHANINGTASVTEVWLDNVLISSLSVVANLGSTPIGRIQIGEVQNARTYNVVLDDIAFGTQRIGM